MTDSNRNVNSVYGTPFYGNPLPPEFAHWSLDLYLDDDEFRAGYPFSNIPEMESNESCESYNSSPTFENDVFQSGNSGDGIETSTTEENNQLTESSAQQQEKQIDGRLQFCLMDEPHENHEIHPNQSNNYNEEELDDDHLHDINDQVSTINIETFEQSYHVEKK